MSPRLVLDSAGADWATAAGCAAVALLAWRASGGAPRLRGLRAAALAVLAVAALKPALEAGRAEASRPRLAVVLDAAPSMASRDDAGTPRLARAVRWLLDNRRRIEERADVTLYSGAGEGRRLSWEELSGLRPDPAADACRLLRRLRADSPAQRAWLFSDGSFGRGCGAAPVPGAAGAAEQEKSLAVDALGVGPRRGVPEVSLSQVRGPDFVFLQGRFEVSADVEASELDGGTVELRLSADGKAAQERRWTVSRPFEVFSATFAVSADRLGSLPLRLEASGRARSGASTKPARRELAVEAIRQKRRIMYLAGRPSFEYAHLREQLKADPNNELVSFVILRNPENPSPVPDSELSLIPFPAGEIFGADLPRFDVFVLENFAYGRFGLPGSYLRNLRDWVAGGGALLLLGGSNAFARGGYAGTPLEEALPVSLLAGGQDDFVSGPFSPRAAAAGHPLLRLGEGAEDTERIWDLLPPLDGYNRFAGSRPGATVLLRHPTQRTASGEPAPVAALRAFGRGKVLLVGTDSTWRWKLGAGRDWRLSGAYARFWNRAVQYLAGGLELKRVRFAPPPERMPDREPAELSLRVFDEGLRPLGAPDVELRVEWTDPAGRAREVQALEKEPGLFSVSLTGLERGAHRVRAVARRGGRYWGDDEARFRWEGPRPDSPLDRAALRDVSQGSGGLYVDLKDARVDALAAPLPPIATRRVSTGRTPLLKDSAALALALALLCLEWVLRRRRGLL